MSFVIIKKYDSKLFRKFFQLKNAVPKHFYKKVSLKRVWLMNDSDR